MSTVIHPTAIIENDVQLGEDCEVHAGAILRRYTILGDRVAVHPYAVIGGDPQYLAFNRSTASGVRIGAGTTIREHVTINRSIKEGLFTEIGENNFFMANAHAAHDCVTGSNVVLANNAALAGHVTVGAHTFIGGGAASHQFTRIGESVMVGGLSRITRDLAPFTMVAERDEVVGLNLLGLKRRGFSREVIRELKGLFHLVYFTPGNIRTIAGDALARGAAASAEGRRFLEFFTSGKRSFARARRVEEAGEEG